MKYLLLISLFFTAVPIWASSTADQRLEDRQARVEEAQLNRESRQADRQQRQEELQVNREERVNQRCEVLASRFETRIARYDNNQSRERQFGDRVTQVTQKIIDKAVADGLDTNAVEVSLQEFETKVADSQSAYDQHINDLRETQDYVCGESEGAYKTELEESRASLTVVREAVLETRNYYQTVLRPAIQALKDQATNN